MVWIGNAGSEGIALKKRSPYYPFLKRTYLEMIQSGHLDKLKIKHESGTVCDPMKNEERKSLSYRKLILLFVIIGVGMVLAMFALTYEILRNICIPTANKIIKTKIKNSKFKDTSTQTEQVNHHSRSIYLKSRIPKLVVKRHYH